MFAENYFFQFSLELFFLSFFSFLFLSLAAFRPEIPVRCFLRLLLRVQLSVCLLIFFL